MADKIFDVEKKKGESHQSMTEDDIKHEALLEISRSPLIKKYFKMVIGGYEKQILELSRPSKIEANKTSLLEFHSKKESLERLLAAADDEARMGS